MRNMLLLAVALFLALAAAAPLPTQKPKPKNQVAVSISNRAFSPEKVTIKKGQSVLWTNNDDKDHTVDAADAAFSSGTLKKKATYQYTFSKTGKFPYACKLHPREKGAITVE